MGTPGDRLEESGTRWQVQASQTWKQRRQYSLAGRQFGLELAVTFTLLDASLPKDILISSLKFSILYTLFIMGLAALCRGESAIG